MLVADILDIPWLSLLLFTFFFQLLSYPSIYYKHFGAHCCLLVDCDVYMLMIVIFCALSCIFLVEVKKEFALASRFKGH